MIHIIDNTIKNTDPVFQVRSPGTHVFFLFNYSGNLSINITKEKSNVFIYGIYIGRKSATFNLHTVQQHIAGSSISDLLIRGVFFDASKFLYQGLIKIHKKAQLSNAYQKNQNLIMSPEAFVDSRPFLEIEANDVRCTHGSTTGGLDKEQLYYLEARGIERKKAEKLLIEGFIEEVFIKIREVVTDKKVATLQQKVLKYL